MLQTQTLRALARLLKSTQVSSRDLQSSLSHHWVKHCQSSSPAWRNSQQKHSRETCFQKHFLQVTTVCGLPKQVQAQLGPSPTQEKHAPNSFLPLLHNYLPVSNLPSTTNFTTPLLHTTTQGSGTSNKRVGKTTCTSQQNCKDNQRLSRSFTKSIFCCSTVSYPDQVLSHPCPNRMPARLEKSQTQSNPAK